MDRRDVAYSSAEYYREAISLQQGTHTCMRSDDNDDDDDSDDDDDVVLDNDVVAISLH